MNYVNDKFQRSFEIVAERFLSKIGFGELIVTFPSGSTKSFKGTNGDEIADLKLHNYKFISKILKRKSISELINNGVTKELVYSIYQKIKINEYKRKQAPPGLRVSDKAFGIGRKLPIINNFNG